MINVRYKGAAQSLMGMAAGFVHIAGGMHFHASAQYQERQAAHDRDAGRAALEIVAGHADRNGSGYRRGLWGCLGVLAPAGTQPQF